MDTNKVKRVLAIIALVFMAIFSVTFVITLVSPKILNGAIAIIALISALLGIGLFLVVRFVLKDKSQPAYLPPDDATDEEKKEKDAESGEQAASDTPDDSDESQEA